MIPYASQIKKTAKQVFKNNSFSCVVASCIFIFALLITIILFEVLGYVTDYYVSSAVAIALTIFAVFPLFLGLLRYSRRLLYGENDNVINIFKYFSDVNIYFEAIKFTVLILYRIVIRALIVLLPSILLKIASFSEIYELFGVDIPLIAPLFSTISFYLAVISFFVLLLLVLKFYLSPFLFVSSDNLDAVESIKMSVVITKRTRLDFIYLIFNMFLYIIASVFVIPIPFTFPIIILTYIIHSIYAVKQYNETLDSINEQRNEQL